MTAGPSPDGRRTLIPQVEAPPAGRISRHYFVAFRPVPMSARPRSASTWAAPVAVVTPGPTALRATSTSDGSGEGIPWAGRT